ncbi:hypothetical protein N7450_011490 [Penicillium hetheringtonii]|uniref:Secreted protein n=1 Tax=Penicillium hetheringtonii TaxID=911720 RepID=A0AAD6DA14_9EURO|nr:hypothetical protein N7450_011490 [Penicillium hetheringtonii]
MKNSNSKYLLAALMMLSATAKAWNITVYASDGCPDTDDPAYYNGDDNLGCTENTAQHRCFILENMGDCWVSFYDSEDQCNGGGPQGDYGSVDEDQPISPDYNWDWYEIWGC